MAKNIFITATRPNEGKTAVTIGVTHALCKRNLNIGFIKPVGQADLEAGKTRIDEDTLLVERACRVHCNIEDMSPVTLPPGFNEALLAKAVRESSLEKVKKAYARVAAGKEYVVLEGTGNASAGAIFGISNAHIAKMLGAKVLLVAGGGIGQPIDEILLNKRYLEREGVEVLGAIINKVYDREWDRVHSIVKGVMEENDIRFLGAIPFKPELYQATMMQVLEALRGDLINGDRGLNTRVGRILVGAMTPSNAMEHFQGNVLLVTPGDRDDMILAALASSVIHSKEFTLSGLILTGDIYPKKAIMEIIKRTDTMVVVVKMDSYTAATRLNNLVVKISPWDREKIDMIIETVGQHVDIDGLIEASESRK
ncbi:MAG: AAA family ATPase [Planctomycetes bacterium]|nr:AAA family ATPase [Planctomycetota bacterium]